MVTTDQRYMNCERGCQGVCYCSFTVPQMPFGRYPGFVPFVGLGSAPNGFGWQGKHLELMLHNAMLDAGDASKNAILNAMRVGADNHKKAIAQLDALRAASDARMKSQLNAMREADDARKKGEQETRARLDARMRAQLNAMRAKLDDLQATDDARYKAQLNAMRDADDTRKKLQQEMTAALDAMRAANVRAKLDAAWLAAGNKKAEKEARSGSLADEDTVLTQMEPIFSALAELQGRLDRMGPGGGPSETDRSRLLSDTSMLVGFKLTILRLKQVVVNTAMPGDDSSLLDSALVNTDTLLAQIHAILKRLAAGSISSSQGMMAVGKHDIEQLKMSTTALLDMQAMLEKLEIEEFGNEQSMTGSGMDMDDD